MTSQEEYIGFDSIRQLGLILAKLAPKKILLVTGKQSFETSGARKLLSPILTGYSIVHFPYNEPNPKVTDIEQGIETFLREGPDVVLTVGGGSVMDTSKMINFFGSNDLKPKKWFDGQIPADIKKRAALIAVPTTSGSGSEATHFAALFIGKEKHSVEHRTMLPDVAIIDPAFSMKLPPYITASSGMDALTQAIESYWNIRSTEESKLFASKAIKLISPNILRATHHPTPDVRLAMAQGAHWAGKAIKITRTTAVHAISYPMTSYFGIPHGHAVGLILPAMYHYISGVTETDLADPRGKEYVIKTLADIAVLLGEKSIETTRQKLSSLLSEIGLETNLKLLGIKSKKEIKTIVTHGFNPERVKNNPRVLSEEALRQMLDHA